MPLVIAISLVGGIWIGKSFFGSSHSGRSNEKLDAILGLVKSSYVDVVDTDSLLEATLPDLLAKLDPHSVYIPADDLESVNEELEG
ncbi:MAG: peptidase S41, partial [Duncaniella sp.]|nr:peptidase S41 [Duncaniella sp.]